MPNKPFVIHDEVSSAIEKNIKTFINSRFNHISLTFHPDELIECGRKLIYRISGKSYNLSYTNSEYIFNQYVRSKWLHILDCKGIKVVDCGIVASDINYNISTIVDCVIELDEDGSQYVVYIKSLPSSEFESVKKDGATRKDIVRIMVDMWLIELANGIIIYENRDNLDFLIYRILPHNSIINSIKAKTKELYEHKIKGTIPLRPYNSHSAKECQECEFLNTCWQGK